MKEELKTDWRVKAINSGQAKIHRDFEKWNNEYNWKQGCANCKGKFGDKEKFVRVDYEMDEFRGDDEVECYHKECYDKMLDLKTCIERTNND